MAALRVLLIRTYRDRENHSMRLYAENLEEALRVEGVQIRSLKLEPVVPESSLRISLLSRADSLYGRFVRLPRATRHAKSDLYHITDQAQGHLIRTLDPNRTIVTCHDLVLAALASGRLRAPARFPFATALFLRSARHLRSAAAVIADSEATRRDVCELLGVDPVRVSVIPPGLNPGFGSARDDRAEVRRRLGISGPTILHVGQTGFYKNLEACIHVVGRLRKTGLDVRLLRAGELLRPGQQSLARSLGIGTAIRDLGPASQGLLAELYRAADVLLFPSLYEGFGWPVLEAMACGLPVVCSNAASLPEVAGDAALFADSSDVDGLARHVAAILENESLARAMSGRGAERAALFTWKRTAEGVLEVYRRVCGS
jgi:glycosyltransferase involved in cell wall biosynthesis